MNSIKRFAVPAVVIALFAGVPTLSSATAVSRELKITRMSWINVQERTAEICGTVSGDFDKDLRVSVLVDPGKYEAPYTAWPDAKNRWCTIVRTYNGKVQATLLPDEGARASGKL